MFPFRLKPLRFEVCCGRRVVVLRVGRRVVGRLVVGRLVVGRLVVVVGGRLAGAGVLFL